MEAIFKGIFDNELTQLIGVEDFLLCLGVSLVLGLIMAAAYMFKNEYTKSFLVTLALLPAVVCVVIMMVNGWEMGWNWIFFATGKKKPYPSPSQMTALRLLEWIWQ